MGGLRHGRLVVDLDELGTSDTVYDLDPLVFDPDPAKEVEEELKRIGHELRRAVVQAGELGVEAGREAVEDPLDIGVGRAHRCRLA